MKILPMTGWFLGISGKSFVNTGLSILASTFTAPALSPIFIIPSQRASTPVSPREVSKAVFDESKRCIDHLLEESSVAGAQSHDAEVKPTTKNAIQI